MDIKFDSRGREIPDPRPIEIPAGFSRPESLQSMMQRLIRDHISRHAADQGEDSFEEANDFEVEDSDEWDDQLTKYEEMSSEFDTRDEVEEQHAAPVNAGQVEPSGLRAGTDGSPLGATGPAQGDADFDAGVNPDPSPTTAARAPDVVVQQPRATIHRRRGNAG